MSSDFAKGIQQLRDFTNGSLSDDALQRICESAEGFMEPPWTQEQMARLLALYAETKAVATVRFVQN